MNTQDDLTRWLARISLGDRTAFEHVYRATSAHLLGVAFRISHHRDRAEEALQEAFVNVWHHAGSFDASVATPMTWLINIVRNKAIDMQRSGRIERERTGELDDEALAVAADESQPPPRLLQASLERLRIDECMAALSASQRQALALAYYRGLAHSFLCAAWARRWRVPCCAWYCCARSPA